MKDLNFISVLSILNKVLLISTAIFLVYIMVATPSMLVPYRGSFGNKINKANLEELKNFSVQLAEWVKISNNSLTSLTTLFFFFGFSVIILLSINMYLIKKLKDTRKTGTGGIINDEVADVHRTGGRYLSR